jgi:hypothetical protein
VAEAEQRVRFEQVGGRVRRARAQAAGATRRIGSTAGLDQRMGRVQNVDGIAVQCRRLLERLRRERPLLALGVALAGLPAAMGSRLRQGRTGSGRSRKRKRHVDAGGATRTRPRLGK